jgi:hypothetical protein
LMNIGALATIAVLNPANLAILCVDNGHYGETGYQKSHTSLGVDLEKIAAGSGIKRSRTVASEAGRSRRGGAAVARGQRRRLRGAEGEARRPARLQAKPRPCLVPRPLPWRAARDGMMLPLRPGRPQAGLRDAKADAVLPAPAFGESSLPAKLKAGWRRC